MGKTILVSAATVVATLLLLVGIAWGAAIFTIDRDGAVRFLVTDAGLIGIGTNNPDSRIHNVMDGATPQPFKQTRYVESIAGAGIAFEKARGSVALPAATADGDIYAGFDYSGHDGDQFLRGARIAAELDGASGNNDMPGRLAFYTTADGTSDIAGTPRMVIKNNGNIGVGRTPTANILEIEGNASKTTAGSWLANSDARIKTDVRDIADALETIGRLRPVKFRYTDDYRAKHPSIEERDYENFIAQEFQQVFPECVRDDGTGLLQIDTYNVIPTLVAAVRDLSRKNEQMEARIRMLEEKTKGDPQ
ncbi:MAG: hypothetical protein A2Z34_09335 [Planctomycetes bacterium RBG_16_59_8]|nr:MAG: hypothetical protein A2Z34_09335 [Planctomycetes bacterium RBG_16_59_8]